MTMTPQERRAKLDEARALMQAVEDDEAAATAQQPTATAAPATPAPAAPAAAAKPTLLQRIKAASTPATQLPTTQAVVTKDQAAVAALAPKPLTTSAPGGDTRVSNQPSLAQTMKAVWQNARGIKK